jgi:hypothetical protein
MTPASSARGYALDGGMMNDDYPAIIKLLVWIGLGSAAWSVVAIIVWILA